MSAPGDNGRLPVTLCVSTYNAELGLGETLSSAAGWVSEIVVVDMGSTDRTVAIARSFDARIVEVPNAGFAEPGRQAGIDAASQPWVLVLDADERAGPRLREVVASYVDDDDVDGVYFARRNYLFGRWVRHLTYWPDWSPRLFRRANAYWPPFVHTHVKIGGRTARAPADPASAIEHRSVESISEWVEKANRYSDLEVDRYLALGRSPSVARLLLYPAFRFVDYYVWRRGYREGWLGLTLGILWFYYFTLVELKLRERAGGRRA